MLRSFLYALLLLPMLAMGFVFVVSGLVPIFVLTLALLLPALLPMLLVGLGILLTAEIQLPTEEQGCAKQSPELELDRARDLVHENG
jgi:hypothetical protein